MDDEVVLRRAARDAVGDVEPTGLRDRIEAQLDGSMVPGIFTLLSARTLAGRQVSLTDDGTSQDGVLRRATGVQLIYDGLRLTRQLARTEPWADGETHPSDLAVLAADVLVARGFFLLARTDAAETAVETVQAFGRDQTVRRTTDDSTLDWNLEADVLELAVVAGATEASSGTPQRLRELARDIDPVSEDGDDSEVRFPPATTFFTDRLVDRLDAIAADVTHGEGVTTTVDD